MMLVLGDPPSACLRSAPPKAQFALSLYGARGFILPRQAAHQPFMLKAAELAGGDTDPCMAGRLLVVGRLWAWV